MSTVRNLTDNLLSLLLIPLFLMLSFLPPRLILRLSLIRDIFLATVNIIFGRLLPPLPPLSSSSSHSSSGSSTTTTTTTTKLTKCADLSGKTALVTGSNSGIGLQIAQDLAQLNATVILACRTPHKATSAMSTIHYRIPQSRGRISAMRLDTSSLDDVRSFAEHWTTRDRRTIDILVHNAGISTTPDPERPLTDEGIDLIYATNLLGSFLLTHLLEPYLSSAARVVFTSSTGQYFGDFDGGKFAPGPVRGVVEPGFHCPVTRGKGVFGGWWGGRWERADMRSSARYGNTKSMQCALVRVLQRKWDREGGKGARAGLMVKGKDDTGVVEMTKGARGRTAHSFTPGFTATPIFGKTVLKSVWTDLPFALLKATTVIAVEVSQGARTGSWLASTEDERVAGWGNGGGYWDRMSRRVCAADLFDDELLEKLWARWEKDAGISWR